LQQSLQPVGRGGLLVRTLPAPLEPLLTQLPDLIYIRVRSGMDSLSKYQGIWHKKQKSQKGKTKGGPASIRKKVDHTLNYPTETPNKKDPYCG